MATDGPERSPLQRLLFRFLYALPYAFVAYVLSVGPMYWKICEAYELDGSQFVYYFYYPLVWAAGFDYVSNFFDWYISLWI